MELTTAATQACGQATDLHLPRTCDTTNMKRITTPFGFRSTAAELARGIDLAGKRAIVTGSASGIGVETARALAGLGAEVTLAVRDLEVGARVAADISATTRNQAVHVARLDLVDRASITALVSAWKGPLHVLVHNAERLWELSLRSLS
jgi:hypothetical protein